MAENEIKIYVGGWERETIRWLTTHQMDTISMVLKFHGVSHKKFTYKDGHLKSVDWVEGDSSLIRILGDVTHAYVREMQRSADRGFDPEQTPLVKQARAAIAKARGEAPRQRADA